MSVGVSVWECRCVYLCAYVGMCVCLCICICTCMCVCVHVCCLSVWYRWVWMGMSVWGLSVCLCVWMCLCVYHCVCMPLCLYTFIYMYKGTLACMFMCECKKAISISCLLCSLRQSLCVNLRWTGWPTTCLSCLSLHIAGFPGVHWNT